MSSEIKSAVRVIVAAAGSGSRMRATLPKQYIQIAGRRIAEHTLEAIQSVPRIGEIVVAIAADDKHWGLLPARLRERVQDTNLVVAYLECAEKAWPTWRRKNDIVLSR